jgi:hypothetical protein
MPFMLAGRLHMLSKLAAFIPVLSMLAVYPVYLRCLAGCALYVQYLFMLDGWLCWLVMLV